MKKDYYLGWLLHVWQQHRWSLKIRRRMKKQVNTHWKTCG